MKLAQPLLTLAGLITGLLIAELLCRAGGYAAWGQGEGPLQPFVAMDERNALGLRGPEPDPAALESKKVVLFLGDSFTFGQGVSLDQAFPALSEHALGGGYVSLNAGVQGGNMRTAAQLLSAHGWAWNPRAVVLQFTLNDAEALPYELRPLTPFVYFEKMHLWRSHLFFLLVRAYNAVVQPYDDYILALYEEGRPGRQGMETALVEIGAECRKRGIKPVFLIFPLFTDFEGYEFENIHAQAAAQAHAAGFTVVDLLEAFKKSGKPAKSFHAGRGDSHPNAEAHRIAAQELLPLLLTRLKAT